MNCWSILVAAGVILVIDHYGRKDTFQTIVTL